MEEKKTIFSYISQVFGMFGFVMFCMLIFTYILGDSAKEISSLYSLGKKGVSLNVMMEFFAVAVLIVLLRYLFFTDRWIKKMSVFKRSLCMVAGILIIFSIFIYLFHWFPMDMWQPWAMFILCFAVCYGVSLTVTAVKMREENEKLEKGLKRLKEQWEEENAKSD